jgi:Flp pilus assembly protein TadG
MRGQSLVEFGLILPVLLTLTGAAIDVARVYQAYIALEGATRDAAEYVATNGPDSGLTALQTAKKVVCTEMSGIAGFSGSATDCTSPSVSLPTAYSQSTTASAGGSTSYPVGSVTVNATFAFRTLFAYPLFTQNGAWTLSSTRAYSVVQGR